MAATTDADFMTMALTLAERGLGQVAPNPAVGCIIVRDGLVVGRGYTQSGGRPHAETVALAHAGDKARGATAYVTLEPCAHTGKTGPCADALIAAGIKRVVAAVADPDSRVAGRGFAMLEKAGIEVTEGVCMAKAVYLNQGFFLKVTDDRPLVTLKIASSVDGRTATKTGHSRWITDGPARERGHLLRATHDAIMIGSATAIVDDPTLTCRLPGLEGRSPVRIIADGRLRLPLTSKLVRSATKVPVWVLTFPGGDMGRRKAFTDCGVELIDVEVSASGLIDMKAAMKSLSARGLTRVLVEGGARIASSLVRGGLVDRVEWFRSSSIVGGDGYPAIAALGIERVDEAPRLSLVGRLDLGDDTLSSYVMRS
ncbi:MAG: bifunctional diaminohydroxyphosphoribosylaminopyrimidine deaminase/5-amino-6-(5-phosphoribosylamino)uracil reductase RibD [Pseudomonadota bacterium]